jgi:hypothetical protein
MSPGMAVRLLDVLLYGELFAHLMNAQRIKTQAVFMLHDAK